MHNEQKDETRIPSACILAIHQWRILLDDDGQGDSCACLTPVADGKTGVEFTLERPVEADHHLAQRRETIAQVLRDGVVPAMPQRRCHGHAQRQQPASFLLAPRREVFRRCQIRFTSAITSDTVISAMPVDTATLAVTSSSATL